MGKVKIAKPGKKLNFVTTNMLDGDGKAIKKAKRDKDKQHRRTAQIKRKRKKAATKTLKKRTRQQARDRVNKIDQEIKKLEGEL